MVSRYHPSMAILVVLGVVLVALWAVPFAFNRAKGAPRPSIVPIVIASIIVIALGLMLVSSSVSLAGSTSTSASAPIHEHQG